MKHILRYARSLDLPTGGREGGDSVGKSLALSLIALWNTEDAIADLRLFPYRYYVGGLLNSARERYRACLDARIAAGLYPEPDPVADLLRELKGR